MKSIEIPTILEARRSKKRFTLGDLDGVIRSAGVYWPNKRMHLIPARVHASCWSLRSVAGVAPRSGIG